MNPGSGRRSLFAVPRGALPWLVPARLSSPPPPPPHRAGSVRSRGDREPGGWRMDREVQVRRGLRAGSNGGRATPGEGLSRRRAKMNGGAAAGGRGGRSQAPGLVARSVLYVFRRRRRRKQQSPGRVQGGHLGGRGGPGGLRLGCWGVSGSGGGWSGASLGLVRRGPRVRLRPDSRCSWRVGGGARRLGPSIGGCCAGTGVQLSECGLSGEVPVWVRARLCRSEYSSLFLGEGESRVTFPLGLQRMHGQ